jgi:uncharacterized protein
MEKFQSPKFIGAGVGLRNEHFDDFLSSEKPDVPWVEVISENFMSWRNHDRKGPRKLLDQICARVPIALHGVSLSIGSTPVVDYEYLKSLKALVDHAEPIVVSDHLCWTTHEDNNLHDLLPLPYTREAATVVVENIDRVQNFLGRRILLENVSSYLEFEHAEMSEWDFLSDIVMRADCGLLVDLNNIYVNSVNHGFDVIDYLKSIPQDRVAQIHMAGHTNKGTHLIDTHDEPVCDEVWRIYDWTLQNWGRKNSMIEWDDQIPTWKRLLEEVQKLNDIREGKHESAVAL